MQQATQRPVLYVEDEEDDVALIKIAFKRAGLDRALEVVTNGGDGIDYMAGRGKFGDRNKYPLPCLIVLDLNLPRKSGFEVLRYVRSELGMKEIPIVIFSSSSAPSDQEDARLAGANHYVVKPTDIDELFAFAGELKSKWLNCF